MFSFLFKALARIPPGLKKLLPKGGVVFSFPFSAFDNLYQNRIKMTLKSTNLAQGGGKGYSTISKNINENEKPQTQIIKTRKNVYFSFKCGAIFSKNEGLNGCTFTVVLWENVINMLYKT